MTQLTDDNIHQVIYDTVKKYFNEPEKCFKKLQEYQYPNSKEYIQYEHAKFFYEKYAKLGMSFKLDKEFTANAYNFNSKIFKDVHCKK